jgi:hypothetical protein
MLWWTINSKVRHRIVHDNAQARDPLLRPIARACYLTLCVSGALISNHRSISRRCATAKKSLEASSLATVGLRLRRCCRCRVLSHVVETSLMGAEGLVLQARLHCGEAPIRWSPRIRGRSTGGLSCSRNLQTREPRVGIYKVKEILLDGFQGLDAPDDHLRCSRAFLSAT